MKQWMAFRVVVLLALLAIAPRLAAQSAAEAVPAPGESPAQSAVAGGPAEKAGQVKGFTLYQKFDGSSNSSGQVLRLTSTAGYNFNKFLGVDFGVPFYFVSSSTSTTITPAPGTKTVSGHGIGDVYLALRLTLENPVLNYSSTLTGAAPTGDPAKGQGTGRATFDWDNRFDHSFGAWTPFVDVGLANTVSDTREFKRPFTTLGKVAHFEAGTDVSLWRSLTLTMSAYDELPWGQQRLFSRVVRPPAVVAPVPSGKRKRPFDTPGETIGGSDLARDNGYNVSLSFSPLPYMNLDVGYTRSVPLHLNTVSWGVGFNLSNMIHRGQGK